ncbi:hypothetical protein [Candidatus Enterococcus murrayae]|uniref:Uncharacterized protein n=1 Tax=Candidatus Enterococcus murrayae TaxID=2815321 RepID=A0ABS3HH32_9ENTE|nr:hypothetical protein [Enterococcus sp. MJM16]MBO0452750.1 hypothetical protein [Enterococcus sp. MJM16]
MSEVLYTPRQLFSLKRKTLEKRTKAYYEETHDEKTTIQILVALQVRDELEEADFSFFMKDLVHHLLFKTKSTRALRRYHIYFQNYFDKKEWKQLTSRLFAITTYVAETVKKLFTQFIKGPLEGLVES